MSKTRQILAVDLGSSALKLAVLDVSGARVKILRTVLKEFPKPPNQKKDDFLKSALQEFLSYPNPPKQVYVVLSPPNVEIMRFDLPYMPREEVPQAIKFKIKDKMSFAVEDSIIDSVVTDEYAGEDGSKRLIVMAAAVLRKEVDSILAVMGQLDLTVIKINAISFGFTGILEHLKDIKKEETVAIAEVGAQHSMVSIYKSKKLVFTRVLPVSSSQVTDSICGVLISDKGKIQLSYDEAEVLKKKFGFPIGQKDMLDGKIMPAQAVAMMRPVLEHLCSEIKRTVIYYTAELKGTAPDKIYLAGGGAGLKNLDEFLSGELGVSAQNLGLPAGIENAAGENKQEIIPFLGLIGAVVPSAYDDFNLLPPELITEKVETIKKASIRMAGFTAICILVVSFIGINLRISGYEKQLQSIKLYKSMVQKVMDMHNEFAEWQEAVSAAKGGEVYFDKLLKQASMIVPQNVVLGELDVNLAEKKVVFKGVVHSRPDIVEDELTRFVEALENSDHVAEANLVSLKKDEIDTKGTAAFEIECIIR